MKSKLHKGMIVKSELKPKVSIKSADFVFTRGADLATKFRLIREAQAVKPVNVVTLKVRTK